MKKLAVSIAAALSAVASFAVAPASASAQNYPIQQIGFDGIGQPICSGPMGPGRCVDYMGWLQQGGMAQPAMQPIPQPMPIPNFGPMGPMGIPTGIVPQDGQIVAQIAQGCGGEPTCMAAAWGTIEVHRCAQGIGVPGGCFGPNGEIMKVINRVLPRNFQPNVIVGNIQNDLRNGPGENNDLVGKNGWVCRTLFGGC